MGNQVTVWSRLKSARNQCGDSGKAREISAVTGDGWKAREISVVTLEITREIERLSVTFVSLIGSVGWVILVGSQFITGNGGARKKNTLRLQFSFE